MTTKHWLATFVFAAGTFGMSLAAEAQITPVNTPDQNPPPSGGTSTPSRSVGRKGAGQVSFGFSLNGTERTISTDVRNSRGQVIGQDVTTSWSGDFNGNWQTGKFVTNSLVIRFGSTFGGQLTGNSLQNGYDVGMTLYLTPGRPNSLYVGGGAGTLKRTESNAFGGSNESNSADLFGVMGFEGVTGENTSVFFEGQYYRLFEEQGATQNRLNILVGIRIRFGGK